MAQLTEFLIKNASQDLEIICAKLLIDGIITIEEAKKGKNDIRFLFEKMTKNEDKSKKLYECFLKLGLKELANHIRQNIKIYFRVYTKGRDYFNSAALPEIEEVIIVKKNMRRLDTDLSKDYKMSSLPKGYCLIINTHTYKRENGDSKILNNEGIKMYHLWNELGYFVDYHTNLKTDELKSTVENFSRMENHKDTDSMVFVMLCDGHQEGFKLLLRTYDDQLIHYEWIVDQFNVESLKGKPKMFFFQLSRGNQSESVESAVVLKPNSRLYVQDALIVYSCYPEETYDQGFTREVCNVLMGNACEFSLQYMLNMITDRLMGVNYDGTSIPFVYESRSFDKKLYFNPGCYGT